MSIFDSKRTKWCKSMSTHVDARSEYNQLTASIGPKGAMAFLGIVHDHYEKNKNLASMKADLVSIYTLFERENVAAKRQYLGELVTKTSSGELGTLLANNLRPEVEYYKTPGVARGATPREVAIDKAANWVCGDYVAGIASVKDILASHVPVRGGDHGKLGAALGPTPAGISKDHKKVVPGAPPHHGRRRCAARRTLQPDGRHQRMARLRRRPLGQHRHVLPIVAGHHPSIFRWQQACRAHGLCHRPDQGHARLQGPHGRHREHLVQDEGLTHARLAAAIARHLRIPT